jgi:hypothetical protein
MRDALLVRVGLPVLLTLLSASAMPAQLCDAAPSLRSVRYRAGVSMGLARQLRVASLGGAAGLRDSPFYSTASVGLMALEDLDRSAFVTGLRIGFEAPLDTGRASGLCPFVLAGSQTGPRNILDTGIDYSDVELGVGLALGRELRHWDNGSLAIAVEGLYRGVFYRYASRTGRVTDATGQSTVTLTLGLTSGRVLVRASASQRIDVKLDIRSLSVGVSILGSRRREAIAPRRRALPD